MIKLVKHCLLALVFMVGLNTPAWAESAAGANDLQYIAIEPAFVLNYGGPGRLKYLKASVTLVTASPLAANTANHHMALVRNELVSLLSRQTDDAVTSPVGQEQMRIDAAAVVKDLFQKEVGHPVIEDLLFTSFIYQK